MGAQFNSQKKSSPITKFSKAGRGNPFDFLLFEL